jgi:hypothetical protein
MRDLLITIERAVLGSSLSLSLSLSVSLSVKTFIGFPRNPPPRGFTALVQNGRKKVAGARGEITC